MLRSLASAAATIKVNVFKSESVALGRLYLVFNLSKGFDINNYFKLNLVSINKTGKNDGGFLKLQLCDSQIVNIVYKTA